MEPDLEVLPVSRSTYNDQGFSLNYGIGHRLGRRWTITSGDDRVLPERAPVGVSARTFSFGGTAGQGRRSEGSGSRNPAQQWRWIRQFWSPRKRKYAFALDKNNPAPGLSPSVLAPVRHVV